jgi:hypothetical protein
MRNARVSSADPKSFSLPTIAGPRNFGPIRYILISQLLLSIRLSKASNCHSRPRLHEDKLRRG